VRDIQLLLFCELAILQAKISSLWTLHSYFDRMISNPGLEKAKVEEKSKLKEKEQKAQAKLTENKLKETEQKVYTPLNILSFKN